MLTESGFDKLNEVMNDYYGVQVTREAFILHEQKFVEGVWDFYDEANGGGISDTMPRGMVANVLARLFTDYKEWPCNGDGPEVFNKFIDQYVKNIDSTDGFTLERKNYG